MVAWSSVKRFALFGLALLAISILTFAITPSAHAALSTTTLTTAAVATDEDEANDEFDSANRIKMNQAVYGTLASGDDVDYYKVDIAKSSTVKITYANDKYRDTDDGLSITFFNKYYEPLLDGRDISDGNGNDYFKYTRPITYTMNLPKGTCYIKVTDDYGWSADTISGQPYHFVLKYVVNKTTITKVTKRAKGFTVRWAKKSGAAKYQVRYATAKSMAKAKTVSCSKKTASKTIKNLKSKKKYWVQIRVLKKISGETYYSAWSAKKAIVTK